MVCGLSCKDGSPAEEETNGGMYWLGKPSDYLCS